jgi:hypothetical protein
MRNTPIKQKQKKSMNTEITKGGDTGHKMRCIMVAVWRPCQSVMPSFHSFDSLLAWTIEQWEKISYHTEIIWRKGWIYPLIFTELEHITITKNSNLSISKTCKKNSNEKFGMCIQFLPHRLKRRSIAGLQEHILLQAAVDDDMPLLMQPRSRTKLHHGQLFPQVNQWPEPEWNPYMIRWIHSFLHLNST